MKQGDIEFLNQLVESLEEAGEKLETAYKGKDIEGFNQVKKFILQVQDKIVEIVR